MAKRLTKALRGKRRWVGVQVNPSVSTREEMEKVVDSMRILLDGAMLKLMDFHPAPRQTPLSQLPSNTAILEEYGGAILQVSLTAYPHLRKLLEEPNAQEKYNIKGFTSSGKIRLVRLRMSMAKPNKK